MVEVVLGVSMTPTAVRMVLVEGADADGVTVDYDTRPIAPGDAIVEQVLAAILGTRDSAPEGGHRLVATGIAWSDHALAARLTAELRAHSIDDVVLVSELHAAGALARAIGHKSGRARTALLITDRDAATLAVVRSSDGAVVKVHTGTTVDDLLPAVTGLRVMPEAPEAMFVIGSGVDVTGLKSRLATLTGLPVHAPGDAELALARGAALACAGAPRFEAETVGLAPDSAPVWDVATDYPADYPTEGASTQLAAAYPPALGYSAMPDDDPEPVVEAGAGAESRPFALVGSAVAALFVVGVIALGISLSVVIRPAPEQRQDPIGTASVPGQTTTAPETIPAPVPVVRQGPRMVVVTPPPGAAPAPAPAAPAPAPAVPVAPAPAAPAPAPAAPAAPAPAPVIPPVVPILTQLWPSVPQPPVIGTPAQQSAGSATSAPATATPTTTTTAPTTTAPTAATSDPGAEQPAPATEEPAEEPAEPSPIQAPVTTTLVPSAAATDPSGDPSGEA